MDEQKPANQQDTQITQPPVEIPKQNLNKKGLWLIIAIIVLLAVGGYFIYKALQGDPKTAKTYTIGLMLPFSGDSSPWGVAGARGVELAKTELGADNITIIKEDTQCDETLAAEAFDRLAARGVIAVIGETCSGASLAALPRANEHKIPMISPSSSSPQLSVPNDYFFRVIPPDTFQGKFAAELVYNKGLRKVALLHSDEAYGTDISKVFGDRFKELGGQIVVEDQFVSDAIDLTPQMNAIKAAKPDAVYFTTNSVSAGGVVLKQIKQFGINAALFTADGVYDKTLISNAREAAEGLIITSFSIGTPAFNKALNATYAIGDASEAYDAFKAIYLAIQKGATTPEEVKNILPSIEFDGASTHVKFDENGEISNNYEYAVLEVKDQQFVPVQD